MTHFKKTNKKLEKLRGIFFQVGLIVAGGLTLVAFEWTSPIYLADLPTPDVAVEEPWELPPIFPEKEEVEKPKVKHEAKPKLNPEKFEIVPDDKKVEIEKKEKKKEEPKFNPGDWKEVEKVDPNENKKFKIVEKMPEFKGSLNKYLSENISYPTKAKRMGSEGKVYIQFLVNKKGEIKDVTILRGVNKWLDEEALRVVKAMPNWNPGKQRGKPVNVIYNLPINFQLKG
ncbi:MAG: TonB family protein [Vicingaceae bacterium]|nr:TonB family protein [Vicingaceae bacterium]